MSATVCQDIGYLIDVCYGYQDVGCFIDVCHVFIRILDVYYRYLPRFVRILDIQWMSATVCQDIGYSMDVCHG